MWMSQDPPRFGFIVLTSQDEAEDCISNLNDRYIQPPVCLTYSTLPLSFIILYLFVAICTAVTFVLHGLNLVIPAEEARVVAGVVSFSILIRHRIEYLNLTQMLFCDHRIWWWP